MFKIHKKECTYFKWVGHIYLYPHFIYLLLSSITDLKLPAEFTLVSTVYPSEQQFSPLFPINQKTVV